tara:strand:+ start:2324 stop:2608 length:285 start_codon:yes stop_codon:yes gene_type:complete
MKNYSRREWNIDTISKNEIIKSMNKYQSYYLTFSVTSSEHNKFMLLSYAKDLCKKFKIDNPYKIYYKIYYAENLEKGLNILKDNFKNLVMTVTH